MKNAVLIALALLTQAAPALAGRQAGLDLAELFPEVPPPGMAVKKDSPLFTRAQAKDVNWAQPPLGCVEEMIPSRPSRRCPDLSRVANPRSDWPENMSSSDKAYWWGQRRAINVCRSEEILRRARENPGSIPASWIELSWMVMESLKNADTKVDAVYEANRTYGVPLHIFTGALYQESLFAELGIADDGGNYSCGVQQINLIGWCTWMNTQGNDVKDASGWPRQKVDCYDPNIVSLPLIKPYYEIAVSRLRGLPKYRLQPEHFANIPLASVVKKFPSAPQKTQELRHQLIQSFVANCSEPYKGIMAKAHEIARLYKQFIPQGFKDKDRYTGGEHFARSCRGRDVNDTYPLHTGWLLTIASYNAGPRSVEALAHYNGWTRESMQDARVVQDLNPLDLVSSLYWAGKYNSTNDLIEFIGYAGGVKNWSWFKGCVVQRHVARVMQHVTLLPTFFVDSLEGAYPCARSKFDSSGRLIETAVPAHRQKSSGRKE